MSRNTINFWATFLLLIVVCAWAQTAQASIVTVTKTNDTDDGSCDTDCSLREAVLYSEQADTIVVPPGTYTLSLGQSLFFETDLHVEGSSTTPTIIQAAEAPGLANARVVDIGCCAGNAVGPFPQVRMTNLTIRHGNGSRVGGGIHVVGSLELVDSLISYNTGQWGGGIFVGTPGSVQLSNSTVSNNTARHLGFGGAFGGAGIAAYRLNDDSGELTLASTTVADNHDDTTRGAGGIYTFNSTTRSINTIIADNTPRQCVGDGFQSHGHNLSGDSSCGFSSAFNDLVGVNPLLAELQDNGGPTETHALMVDSPAIDAGLDSACPATDQRGLPRDDGECDIGSFEVYGGGPSPSIGGSVTGMSPILVACHNLTSFQSHYVLVPPSERQWSCNSEGFSAEVDDIVYQSVFGLADDSQAPVGGEAGGVEPWLVW